MRINWKYILVSLGILGLEIYQSMIDDERVDELEERVKQLEAERKPVNRKRSSKR